MSRMLEVALKCIGRGWYVFPCRPKGKEPMVPGGFKSASYSENDVRAWWTKWPDANVGIATGASGLTVLDIDYGVDDLAALRLLCSHVGLPVTYAVRTGRRPGFGVQLYFNGGDLKSIAWNDDAEGASGDVRSGTGYVLAEGSYHPSGAFYEPLVKAPIADCPEYVRNLRPAHTAGLTGGTNAPVVDDGGPITTARNVTMISLLGRYRVQGHDDDEMRKFAIETNETRCVPPLGEDELERLITNACKYPMPEPDVPVLIGGKIAEPSKPVEPPKDWRTRYATAEQFRNVQPPSFLIRDFLEDGSITAIGAPVAQRKSIVVANVIHALLTGEPLFGHFEVVKKPERILYLCPEMGLVDIASRFRKLGLESYVGESLFIRTMDDPKLSLTELDEELPGALLILDTITRFVEGNQNDAEDMAKFADLNYAIKRRGATLLLLHHAVKGTAGTMTLDTALRGSTELAAFVTCVWSTQLQNPDAPHTTPSNLKCVKQRGFASEAFQVACDPDFRMTMLGTIGEIKSQKQVASEDALAEILKRSPTMGINKLQEAMRAAGHPRGGKWITAARAAIVGGGVSLKS